jgi:predicted transcriptional regulator YdeE
MTQSTTIEIEEFKVIGISVRTTNQNRQSQNDIGNLWGKFIEQNLIGKIPNKNSLDIYCIYTNYESDFNGLYTAILGCKVNSFDNIPEGFISWTIPKTKYQVYKSTGKLPDSVLKTWTNIWQSDTGRKYVADFDVYGQKSQNTENAEVDTYVSIK